MSQVSKLVATIDRAIHQAEEEAKRLRAQAPAELPGAARGTSGTDAVIQRLESLNLLVLRLNQLKEWITQDPRLFEVVDGYIGQRVREMQQHLSIQAWRLAIATTVTGTVLGWLISILGTPLNLLHFFGL